MPTRRSFVRTSAALLALPMFQALALQSPTGPVVLSITGRVFKPNTGARADFDMAMLASMPQHSFSTRSPWFDTARRFTGPLLREVLGAADAQGETLRAYALDDYSVELPVTDPQRYDVLLARLLDGKPMAVRDKGPLFMIYPFDSDAALRNAVHYNRSAWQLRRIEVK